MLSEPNISYKSFWGICRPLKSWRANSPNPIQIYCAEISSRLKQSDYALSKLVKQQTGKTFKDLLQSRRFYRAEELLLDTNLSIDDIIYVVGYESHSYFFRRFKEKYGVTPSQYRKKRK